MQPNKEQVVELSKNSIVAAWIKTYRKDSWCRHPKCNACGWPHAPNLLCGSGATFGETLIGAHTYYIDASNVEFMLHFVGQLGSGFHWRDEIFFEVKADHVIVSRIEPYNNSPHIKKWMIPLREWQSITEFVESRRPSKGISMESFLEKIGLSEAEQSKLAGMNDEGKSFMEIAAYIRANL